VIAVATHDTGSAVAAVPFRGPESVFLSVGTWSLVGVEIDEPLITDETFAANLTNEGGVAGTFRLLRNVTGLWLLHECRRGWESEGNYLSFAEIIRLADAAPPLRSLIDPDDESFAGPGDVPMRVAEFCRRTGQPAPEEPGATARCILESIALKHAAVVGLLCEVTGRAPAELHIVGGGAKNELLCRWTAEAAGLPVVAGPAEATLIGNLLVQAIALGELGSLEQARDVVRASFVPTVYEPSFSPAWAEAGARFAELLASRAGLEVGS
jgi:rhamnulokinase